VHRPTLADGHALASRSGDDWPIFHHHCKSRRQPGHGASAKAKVEEEHGEANITPAFRGLVYIVSEELPLDEFGNRLPPITAEVAWAGQDELPEQFFDSIPLGESIFPNILNTAGNGLVNFWLGYRVEFRNGNIQVGGFPGGEYLVKYTEAEGVVWVLPVPELGMPRQCQFTNNVLGVRRNGRIYKVDTRAGTIISDQTGWSGGAAPKYFWDGQTGSLLVTDGGIRQFPSGSAGRRWAWGRWSRRCAPAAGCLLRTSTSPS
jgi:hypothetical protein